ncbi:MAG: hypothetical protein OES79_04710 [Planctomycetota bacterium]|nr:hypothetical protein [Planctomycetota bacterium]
MRFPAFITYCFAIALLGAATVLRASADQPAPYNYVDHVRPILRQHCLACHNAQRSKGGLVLETYAAAMEGGSSGEVVLAGDLESSRLWGLVSHQETPEMPPEKERLPDDNWRSFENGSSRER